MIPYYAPTYFGRVIFQHGSGCIVKWSENRKKAKNFLKKTSKVRSRFVVRFSILLAITLTFGIVRLCSLLIILCSVECL